MSWKTIRRETGLIEHVCGHGVGHPNAGSIQYMAYREQQRKDDVDWVDAPLDLFAPTQPFDSHWGIHGCDGCCSNRDFPGSAIGSIRHAYSEYLRLQEEKDVYGRDFLNDLFKDHFLLFWGVLAAVNEANYKGLID